MSGMRITMLLVTLIVMAIIMLAQLKQYKAQSEVKEQVVTKVKTFEENYKKSMDEAVKRSEDDLMKKVDQFGR